MPLLRFLDAAKSPGTKSPSA